MTRRDPPAKPRSQPADADPAHQARKPAGSEGSDTHAGQEADRIDATLRNVSEGYGGPKVDEDRRTPREVAKREGQKDY